MYLSVLEQGDKLNLKRIQQQLWERDRKQVSIETIQEVLIKLSRGDLIDYKQLGGWFRKVSDPILLEFLKVWGQIDVEGLDVKLVQEDLKQNYQNLTQRISELKGYLAEVYMSQILLNTRDEVLPGYYFHQDFEIKIPDFVYVRLRERLGPGAGIEIDVHGGAGIEQWVAESKWVEDRKVGVKDIKELLQKAKIVKKDRNAKVVRTWFFGHDGFTPKAKDLMQEHGMFWSTRKELDELLEYVKLRRLPKL